MLAVAPTGGQRPAERVVVIGAVSEQHLAGANRVQHVGGAASVVRVAVRQLQADRQAAFLHYRVQLSRHSPQPFQQCYALPKPWAAPPAARTPHASAVRCVPGGGVGSPLLPLAACWWTRMVVESTIAIPPA